jgi:hypothetical protein
MHYPPNTHIAQPLIRFPFPACRISLTTSHHLQESHCRFCKQALPSWKAAYSDLNAAAAPVMSIQFNGHTYWLQVKPGECGVEQFKDDVRRLLGLSVEQAFDITFECRVPGAGVGALVYIY